MGQRAGAVYLGGERDRGGSSAELNVHSGGSVTVGDQLKIWSGSSLNLAGGTVTAGGVTNRGAIGLSGGVSHLRGAITNEADGTIIVSDSATATFYDDLLHNGSEIRVSGDSHATFFGDVSGGGDFTGGGILHFEGSLSPGNSADLVMVDASEMRLGINSITTIEIGGLLRGSEYDAYDVTGELILGGTLQAVAYDLGDGLFTPLAGDSFDLFTADNISGSFSVLDLWALDGLAWDLRLIENGFNGKDVLRLSAVNTVPLPPAAWLFLTSLLGMVFLSRRQRVAA